MKALLAGWLAGWLAGLALLCGCAAFRPTSDEDLWKEMIILGNAYGAADEAVKRFVPLAPAIFPGCQSVQVVEIVFPKGQEMAIARAVAKDDEGKQYGNVYFYLTCTVESCQPVATHWKHIK